MRKGVLSLGVVLAVGLVSAMFVTGTSWNGISTNFLTGINKFRHFCFSSEDADAAKLIRYTGQDGTVFYVDALSKVPEKYRKSAEINLKLPKINHFDVDAAHAPSGGGLVLYVTSWCPICKSLEAELGRRQIPFVRRDVEKDRDAAVKFRNYGGNGVPLVTYNGKVIEQSIQSIQRAMGKAA